MQSPFSSRPYGAFFRILAVISVTETAIMFFLPLLPISSFAKDISDTALLALISTPFLWWLIVRPIRRTAHAILLEETTKSETILSAISDGISIQSADFRILYQNQAHKDLFGTHMGEYCYEAYKKGTTVCEGCPTSKTFRDGGIHTDEKEALTQRGILSVEITSSPLRNASGEIIAGIEVIRDITERKKAESEIRQAYNFTKTVLDSISEAIAIINVSDLRIIGVNSAFLEEFESREEDVIGTTCHMATHHRTAPCAPPDDICPLSDMLRTGMHKTLEHVHYAESGEKRYVEVSTFPIRNEHGEIIQAVHVSRDITERKKIEGELMKSREELIARNRDIDESKQKIEAALNQISALIRQVAMQKDFGIRFNNPDLKECYKEMDCGKTECPCYGKGKVQCWQIAGTYCGGRVQGLFANKYKDCSVCRVFKTATSDPIYLIGEQFNNMMHILEMQHKELETAYSELKSAHAQVLQQEKMASIGQLAAGVAQEINNPTGFIMSNLGSLLKYAAKLSEFIKVQAAALDDLARQGGENRQAAAEKVGEKRRSLKIDYIMGDLETLVEESLEGAERIKKIVQDLKSFSRVDEAECKTADLNAGLDSTINIVWNELKYKAAVRKDYGELPQIRCNPGQLNQVFMNILVNAAHAIEKQGEITVKTRYEEGRVYVSISDTGCGIPEDRLEKIFEPFYTTKEVGKGTGLGLSIAYDIVKKHNGEIRVESTVGRGTTFTVKIPVAG